MLRQGRLRSEMTCSTPQEDRRLALSGEERRQSLRKHQVALI
jgi:hypothetical protein